ncbi:putative NADH-ubiquinone oxidoreductase chain 4L/K family protein [Octadecabacter antarcticus 307]|uniref:Putative NADH-ubiquinone oxidoreductase chain 4L/K family protein n=1 Tax=Octadecabacter antarcticus 307 TaxID=391626 RepID=M9RGE9_9RHOB|nr:NADH-quinone oxidoreductase subunit K [Octadecabacter antarcticus]AGI68885.1 putative NADH-ubiquinone oxidoreductase chain 4L/K family protein [Octadecabacter antarcticus 307]
MTSELIYICAGSSLVGLALYRLATYGDMLLRVLSLNVLAIGIAVLIFASARNAGMTDPVPQAFVLTGIVVLVGVTAALLALAERIDGHDDE